ncbi:hypothetical protein ACFVT9_38440 [Kitasatospora cineracea]|uniref:hypothetical protein n=1 Tax=Kitasatospora cineracea TaxID=88074 RepID=UPI0036DDB18E
MLVRTELMPSSEPDQVMVRVHTPVGHAVVVWRGEPHEAAGGHFIEWSVGEDILWGINTRLAPLAEPEVREEAGCVVLRGRLELVEGPVAVLAMGDSQVGFIGGRRERMLTTAESTGPGGAAMSASSESIRTGRPGSVAQMALPRSRGPLSPTNPLVKVERPERSEGVRP